MDENQILSLGRWQQAVEEKAAQLRQDDFAARFWQKDPALWAGGAPEDVASMLGWIDVVGVMESRVDELTQFAQEIRDAGFERVVLAGMGGSSLAPYVLSTIFPKQANGLPLHVLDSTHPETVLQIANEGALDKTLVVVASKSGSTAEPTAFDAYFFDKIGKPENFVAITDPGSPFHKSAEARGFRKIFLNFADIGGRYSALSYFGLVPAALLGIDVAKLLARAAALREHNREGFGAAFELGTAMGVLANDGVDKLTFVTTPELEPLGLWLEQLVAESTGKHGKGILPVAGERLGDAMVYGRDRFFAELRFAQDGDLPNVPGHPSVKVVLDDPYGLATEFLRWEIATATAGAVIGINPFDQPNVQESKDVTKKLLKTVEEQGALPDLEGGVATDGVTLFGESCADDLRDSFAMFFNPVKPGDYVAIQAYLHETPELTAALQDLQAFLRDRLFLATTLGYGPRFLHSTGQYHKGGPNVGFFLQFTDEPSADDSIPGQKASWKQFVHAQARGDMEALQAKDRRIVSVNLGPDPLVGLGVLRKALEAGIAISERE